MKKTEDTMRTEYKRADFNKLERGKFYKATKDTAVVLLDPALAKAFPTSASVNEALRGLLTLATAATKSQPKRTTRKRADA